MMTLSSRTIATFTPRGFAQNSRCAARLRMTPLFGVELLKIMRVDITWGMVGVLKGRGSVGGDAEERDVFLNSLEHLELRLYKWVYLHSNTAATTQ